MDLLRAATLPAVAISVLAAIVIAGVMRRRSKHGYPPGPSRLSSLVASVFNFEDYLQYKEKWKKRFGKVYKVFLGRMTEFVMTDYDVIHDAFVVQADDCSSRPNMSGALLKGVEDKGLINSPDWREQRRFALTVLREQGMGKVDMERKIMEEVRVFMQEMESSRSEPVSIESLMHKAISNIICSMVLGTRFDYDDGQFNTTLTKFLDQFRVVRKMAVVATIPFLQWLPGDIFGYHEHLKRGEEVKTFFTSAIRQHAQKLDPENPQDFIDYYLIEIKKSERSGQGTSFDEANCLATVLQLFLAGTDTTANTLMWAWLFMILHPQVQAKVQREIDERVGSRPPNLKDRANMPYSEAVLTEILRLANTAASSIPHKTDRDMNVGGYFIPKDCIITSSLSDVHLSEENYHNPKQFNPDRFLGPDGSFVKPKKFIPFGIGRRACAGESLARAELFLFFASVLQQFNLEVPRGCTVKAEGKLRPVHKPVTYSIVFRRRTVIT